MIKRLIPVLCVLSILFTCFVPAVGAVSESAADPPVNSILDYRDFVSGFRYVEESKIETVSFPVEYCSIYSKTSDGISWISGAVSGRVEVPYKDDCFAIIKLCYPGSLYSEPRYFLALDNIVEGTPLHVSSNFYVDPSFVGSYNIYTYFQVHFYDKNFQSISSYPIEPKCVVYNDCSGRFEGVYDSDSSLNDFSYPDSAKYCCMSLSVRVQDVSLAGAADEQSDQISFDFGFSDYALDVSQELPPFDAGSVFSVFGSVGTWFTDQIGSLTSIFWDADVGTLTFIGILAVCALAVAVIVLIIYICSRFLHFRS